MPLNFGRAEVQRRCAAAPSYEARIEKAPILFTIKERTATLRKNHAARRIEDGVPRSRVPFRCRGKAGINIRAAVGKDAELQRGAESLRLPDAEPGQKFRRFFIHM